MVKILLTDGGSHKSQRPILLKRGSYPENYADNHPVPHLRSHNKTPRTCLRRLRSSASGE